MPDECDAASIRISNILTIVRGGGVERQVGLEGSLKSIHLIGYKTETRQHVENSASWYLIEFHAS
jgi:hypothetical protein